ncbi:MAG: DUF1552 domain-containing protein [Planctomycetota bacterium]
MDARPPFRPSRRRFLRGAGAALALPWLETLDAPFREPGAAPGPLRHVFVFLPNGIHMADWTPSRGARLGSLPYILEPLEELKRDLTVVSGLALEGGFAQGDGAGDHARSAASYLTCAHPRKTGGADILNGESIDQALAGEIGQGTLFRSLELGLERGRAAGSCDSGYSCAYSNNISWRTPTQPVAKETDPREVFRRLFGDPDAAADRAHEARERRRRRSVIDFVLDDMKTLSRSLSRRDREKIEEYTTALRELELRLSRMDDAGRDVAPPAALGAKGGGYRERLDLMYELLALALEADLTRVATFMTGNAGSNRGYPELGIAEGHHDISHHGKDPANYDKLRRINRFHLEAFARFAKRLATVEEGGRRLLDDAVLMIGAGLSDGNRHYHADLPIALVGRGGKLLRGGRHLEVRDRTPAGELYLAMLRNAGSSRKSFGDGERPLGGL